MAILKKKGIAITYGMIVLIMLIGSFFDLQLSQALFDLENGFGRVAAAFGEYPGMLCAWTGVALYFAGLEQEDKRKPQFIILLIGLICFGIVSNTIISFMEIHQFMPEAFVPGMILELAVSVGAFFFTLKKADGDRKTMRTIAVILCLLPLAEVILVNIIKTPWGRPRFRAIAITEGLHFRPWWVIGSELRSKFVALGVKSGEFSSFPSGHTANAACLLMTVLLPLVLRPLQEKSGVLLAISILFTAIVAISRIIVGAHFLTDVTMGFAITHTLFILSVYSAGIIKE